MARLGSVPARYSSDYAATNGTATTATNGFKQLQQMAINSSLPNRLNYFVQQKRSI